MKRKVRFEFDEESLSLLETITVWTKDKDQNKGNLKIWFVVEQNRNPKKKENGPFILFHGRRTDEYCYNGYEDTLIKPYPNFGHPTYCRQSTEIYVLYTNLMPTGNSDVACAGLLPTFKKVRQLNFSPSPNWNNHRIVIIAY